MAKIVTPVNSLMADVSLYQYNPGLIQRSVLSKLSDAMNGTLEIVDPTNPFVFSLESASVLTAAAMVKNEANTRKQYPYSAQDEEDLYLHMSDKDYIDRFATPSSTTFSILIPKEELLVRMCGRYLHPITQRVLKIHACKVIIIIQNKLYREVNS